VQSASEEGNAAAFHDSKRLDISNKIEGARLISLFIIVYVVPDWIFRWSKFKRQIYLNSIPYRESIKGFSAQLPMTNSLSAFKNAFMALGNP
jgi:hypothetical protein